MGKVDATTLLARNRQYKLKLKMIAFTTENEINI